MASEATVTEGDRDALKRAAAEAAVELVQDGMVVGLGTGSTAAFAVEALARRHRQGLRFVGIPTSERTAAQARAGGIPLTSFAEHRQIDLTIDGADEVERGTLEFDQGAGRRLAAREDRRQREPATRHHRRRGQAGGSSGHARAGAGRGRGVRLGRRPSGARGASARKSGCACRRRASPFVTDSGNHILDCHFAVAIDDPARLEERIRRIVGVVESGLFIGRADPVFVADKQGVSRLDSARQPAARR